jgi:hypothetical protein
MINIVQGRVKFPADKDWPSTKADAPDYTSLKVDVNGQEVRVFCNVGTTDYNLAKSYKKGDQVTLSEDKGKYKLVGVGGEMADAVRATTPPPAQDSAKTKEATKEKAEKWADIYADIFNRLSEKLPVTTPAETIGSAASTVFIALTRN